jgi:GT2 family glycosyltransferase
MYGEDIEFCFRAVQRGFRIGIVDKAYIYHKGNASSQFNSLFYEYHINRGHFLLCNKLSKNITEYRLSFVIKTFSLAMRALLRSFKYKNTNAILGYKQAIVEPTNVDFNTPRK